MLVHLLNIPQNPSQWAEWSFHHRTSHDAIRQAIVAKGGPRLTDYQVEPISPDAPKQFLQNNSQLHIEANGALSLQSADLLDANLSDQRELSAWISSHYLEHFNLEARLGL